MSLLLSGAELRARRAALGTEPGSLSALADSLAADLEPVLARALFVPAEKARLSRRGGRCEADGVLLAFDPFAPDEHQCPTCGRAYRGDAHYRWWVMGYQLWLAERAVHAAALFALRGDPRHRDFAARVLDAYAERYLAYPNRDNVLGPTRPFFSTYLESIWLLQLAVALDLLEDAAPDEPMSLGARVRDRLIEPSLALIGGFDEGLSNRQVWNNAALIAGRRLLDDAAAEAVLDGPSGLEAHLAHGLLADGTWYEGENYHLFAHRGLWYGVRLAERMGVRVRPPLAARFREAYATPFLSALPDFTFPSRRDSQYAVSLRQWRFAELAELGLAECPDDERLLGALGTLYDGSVPRGDTGRWRSTAEAERNGPATALERRDLGWRSLLHACPSLPAPRPWSPRSVLLAAQGLAILRRDGGTLYAALDYGHSGAGHGHPDRLNVLLVHDDARWLDDVGTGSYVDASLHWYRSTLAHNAPLVNGRSQRRVHGALRAFEDRGAAGWVMAEVDGIAPGVHVERALVVMPDYAVDELTWRSASEVTVDLPIHAEGTLDHPGPWRPDVVRGGAGREDGFGHLSDTRTAPAVGVVRLAATAGSRSADAHIIPEGDHLWWRARAPGPPGGGPREFQVVRMRGRRGGVTTVWSWAGAVRAAARADGVVTVELHDGARHRHRPDRDGWHIELDARGAQSTIDLAGAVARSMPAPVDHDRAPAHVLVIPLVPAASPTATDRERRTLHGATPLVFELGEPHYARSELTWREAGTPTARVALGADRDALRMAVEVRAPNPVFAPAMAENELDNEPADVNRDGVQVHVVPAGDEPDAPNERAWLLVPEPGGGRVRVTARGATGLGDIAATWRPTAEGYALHCAIPRAALGDIARGPFRLGVLVNDMGPGRERRRGQLVLGGGAGDFVYLRGDRHPLHRYLWFTLADA